MVKVKRVLGNKVNISSQFKFFQENPDIYHKLMRYNETELPIDIAKEISGIVIVNEKLR